jgi:membrane protease YdiL (CAAX protease family)
MKTIKALIKSHPLLSYFVLTFAISWGGILIVVGGPGAIPGTKEQVETLFPIAILAMLAGPPVAGIVLTDLLYGRAGLHDLLTRMRRWRVEARWYAVALLTAPLSMMAALLALSLTSPEYLPGIFASDEKATLVLMGIVPGLAAGFLEELGWTGFAIPRMRLRYGVVGTGLFVGVPWGAWHILTNGLWASDIASGTLPLAIFLPAYLFTFLAGQLPAYRVLMVWVYDRTGESLLLAMLMHASLTASTFILAPLAMSGVALLAVTLAYAAAAWVVVAVLAVATRGHLSRQPLRGRVA